MILRRQYCFNCKDTLATVKVMSPCGDMTEWVCDECFEKRPEGWERACEESVPVVCPNCDHERTVSRDVFEESGRIGPCPKCCSELCEVKQ